MGIDKRVQIIVRYEIGVFPTSTCMFIVFVQLSLAYGSLGSPAEN